MLLAINVMHLARNSKRKLKRYFQFNNIHYNISLTKIFSIKMRTHRSWGYD